MKIPELKIGELKSKIPIIQGGMGIGVSLSGLASAVCNEGGIGVISGVQIGFKESDFKSNPISANLRSLKNEIRRTRELLIDKNSVFGINLMVAQKNYVEYVKEAISEKISFIVSGAGLPLDLPKIIGKATTKAIPIVSSGKAADLILKVWESKHNYVPDCIVIEGCEAGGHLGFKESELENNTCKSLEEIFNETKKITYNYEVKYKKKISLIVGGGIFSGKDIGQVLSYGADGVQMASRFVATHECDAHINFKNKYVNAKKEDIVITKSPVGLPGRAIKTDFLERIYANREKIDVCYNCIKPCNPRETLYCISKALINSVTGDTDNGLVFCGSKTYKIDKIVKVKELINELNEGIESL